MAETAKDIGPLVGDDDPRISQIMVAAREAETMREAAATVPAIREWRRGCRRAARRDEEAEASDGEVAAAQASPRCVMLSIPDPDHNTGKPRIGGLGDDVLDSADLVDEEPAIEKDEVDEGFVFEEEGKNSKKTRKKTSWAAWGRGRGLLALIRESRYPSSLIVGL